MRILLLQISFHLPACQSLKEKRRRLGGIADKLGRNHRIAVIESGQQDQHRHSTWSFVIAAATQGLVDRECARIESLCHELDVVVGNIDREWLL